MACLPDDASQVSGTRWSTWTIKDEIATVLDHVRGLQKDIPGIVETQAGENLSPNNQGYIYGFVMHFVDAEHLKAYAPHPAHQVVSKELQAMCESIIDFDIA